jgi:hypothetical protein
MDRGWRWL